MLWPEPSAAPFDSRRAGSYSTAGSSSATCTSCGTGKYAKKVGASAEAQCLNCAAGTYSAGGERDLPAAASALPAACSCGAGAAGSTLCRRRALPLCRPLRVPALRGRDIHRRRRANHVHQLVRRGWLAAQAAGVLQPEVGPGVQARACTGLALTTLVCTSLRPHPRAAPPSRTLHFQEARSACAAWLASPSV